MSLTPIEFTHDFPLFPLPNCVLFPGVVQPLHIFEARYCAMMRTALEDTGDGGAGRTLAVALLKPGWEKDYYGTPPVHDRLCAGRIIAHELLADGKYNLLLQGVARARLLAERPAAGDWGVFRLARLEPLVETAASSAHQTLQRRVIQQMFEKTALKELTVTPALAALFEDSVPVGRLIDALAFALIQDVYVKQSLLEEADVATRGELLLRQLIALAARLDKKTGSTSKSPWPPEPGQN